MNKNAADPLGACGLEDYLHAKVLFVKLLLDKFRQDSANADALRSRQQPDLPVG
jgi:hypothetical protein